MLNIDYDVFEMFWLCILTLPYLPSAPPQALHPRLLFAEQR